MITLSHVAAKHHPRPSRREQVYTFFNDPTSSRKALYFALYLIIIIVISAILFCVETLPTFHGHTSSFWLYSEIFIVANFTIEYVIRLSCASNLIRHFFEPLNLIDFLAILPFYLELLLVLITGSSSADLSGLVILRILRLTRVFRVFKLSKYSSLFRLVSASMRRSGDVLALLAMIVAELTVIFASMLFYAEQTTMAFDPTAREWRYTSGQTDPAYDNQRSAFQSIPHTFFWAVTTITTTGYGAPNAPVSVLGKVFGAMLMMISLVVIAFPITVISTNFMYAYQAKRRADLNALEQKSPITAPPLSATGMLPPVRRMDTPRGSSGSFGGEGEYPHHHQSSSNYNSRLGQQSNSTLEMQLRRERLGQSGGSSYDMSSAESIASGLLPTPPATPEKPRRREVGGGGGGGDTCGRRRSGPALEDSELHEIRTLSHSQEREREGGEEHLANRNSSEYEYQDGPSAPPYPHYIDPNRVELTLKQGVFLVSVLNDVECMDHMKQEALLSLGTAKLAMLGGAIANAQSALKCLFQSTLTPHSPTPTPPPPSPNPRAH